MPVASTRPTAAFGQLAQATPCCRQALIARSSAARSFAGNQLRTAIMRRSMVGLTAPSDADCSIIPANSTRTADHAQHKKPTAAARTAASSAAYIAATNSAHPFGHRRDGFVEEGIKRECVAIQFNDHRRQTTIPIKRVELGRASRGVPRALARRSSGRVERSRGKRATASMGIATAAASWADRRRWATMAGIGSARPAISPALCVLSAR